MDSIIMAPILQLHTDILGYIFSLNSDLEEQTHLDHASLVTLRHMSQVCAYWRELVIGSPSLWAQALDIDLLCQAKDEWRKEVMRRTGNALLHLKLSNKNRHRWSVPQEDAVEWLLSEHWTRIRFLDLQFGWSFQTKESTWRELFQRPAPSLEVFKFEWPLTRPPGYLHAPDFVLFSRQAPCLTTICGTDMRLDLTTFPLPNLRILRFKSSSTAVDLLDALSQTPALETLAVEIDWSFTRNGGSAGKLAHVCLPRLTSLYVRVFGCVNSALSFIEHLTPAKGCTLQFSGNYCGETPDDNSVNLSARILSSYSRSCSDLAAANNPIVILGPEQLHFVVDLSNHRQFSFTLEHVSPEATPHSLLFSVASLQLNTITKLSMLLQYTGQIHLNPDIEKFVRTLVSVQELQTLPLTFLSLLEIQTHTTTLILPSLRVIDLMDNMNTHLPHVADFINARIQLGISADTLVVRVPGGVDVESFRKSVPGVNVECDFKF